MDQAAQVSEYRGLLELGPPPESAYQDDEELSLRSAVLLANAANERLSIEGERYLQSLIDRQRNAASLLPTLDLFGEWQVRENVGSSSSGNNSSGSTGSNSDNSLFDGGLRAQYTLLTGLSDFRRVSAAQLTGEQRLWLLLDLREGLLLETVRAYYSVLLAERQVRVLESSFAVQDERLRDIRGRREVGFARPLDVAQIEAQASETRVSLLDAQNAVDVARAALTLLTGVDIGERALSDGFEPRTVAGDDGWTRDVLNERALVNRRDLAAALAAAAAARERVDAEIGRYYPSVSVNLEYFLTRDLTPTDRDWTGLLTLNLPLFSAGRIDADVRAAWSVFRQTVLEHSLTRREIRRDVDVAWADLESTQARIIETRHQVSAAEEAIRQAEAAYQAGLGTNLERITAQDQLLSAQLRAAREEYNEKIAYLAAMRAAGVLTTTLTGEDIAPERLPMRREAPDSPFVVLPGHTIDDDRHDEGGD